MERTVEWAHRDALHAPQERRQTTKAEVRAVDVEAKHRPLHSARGAVVSTGLDVGHQVDATHLPDVAAT